MTRATILLAISALFFVGAFSSATAQQRLSCAPRDVVVDRLKSKYSEARVMLATAGKDGSMMVETYANNKTGSWTVITSQQGPLGLIACVMLGGDNWHGIKPPNTDPAS